MSERADTPRARAHARTRAEIVTAARSQLATRGADGLSLRAVAREVGMVSSAVYRYFTNRDDLLTALIIESYDTLGERVEQAVRGHAAYGRRFVCGLDAFRGWAMEHPHEYALLYGSPVPGYAAPQQTIAPAARAPAALLRVVAEASDAGMLSPGIPVPRAQHTLLRQAAALGTAVGVDLPVDAILRFAHAWAQAFGLVSLEAFGQLKGTFEPADALATHTFRCAAAHLGLTV